MTAEQLEELLASIGDPNNPNAASCMADLWREAPSLARRVIAAEKLVEALGKISEALFDTCYHAHQDVEAALTAYREASK